MSKTNAVELARALAAAEQEVQNYRQAFDKSQAARGVAEKALADATQKVDDIAKKLREAENASLQWKREKLWADERAFAAIRRAEAAEADVKSTGEEIAHVRAENVTLTKLNRRLERRLRQALLGERLDKVATNEVVEEKR